MKHSIAQNAKIGVYENKTLSEESQWVPARGELVRALCADGAFRQLKVWDIGERVVYLCSEDQYRALELGARNQAAIGFPKRDVFKLEEYSNG